MTNYDILQALNGIDDESVNDAKASEKRAKPPWRKWGALAACLCLCAGIACGAMMLMPRQPTAPAELPQQRMEGVLSEITGEVPTIRSQFYLAPLTESQLFSEPGLCAVRGEITDIKNYYAALYDRELDYHFDEYFSVLYVKIEKVYQGDFTQGDTVRIYVCAPINQEGVWYEDSGTISQARVGQKAIFTPKRFQEEHIIVDGHGGEISLLDIADCVLGDGERWAFIETGKGLAFADFAYPGAKGLRTLDEIEAYVIRQLP